MTPRIPGSIALLTIMMCLLVPAVRADTIIENGDGTHTVVLENGCWYVFDEQKQVVDEGCQTGATPEVQVVERAPASAPTYDGIQQGQAQPTSPTKKFQCADPNESCNPGSFKQSGSRYFDLYFCPTDCGWEAFGRVEEVIDSAWDKISLHLGALYDTKVKGYIYTTGSQYKEGSGAPSWSGGVFKPGSNQIHVPAPQGRSGWELEELLIHELTHFRLQEQTYIREYQESAISNYKFLNEGIAQMMEQILFEEGGAPAGKTNQRRRSLWVLKQAFDKGVGFQPLKSMMFRYGKYVSLFYAQSWATVAYIRDKWGSRGIEAVVAAITKAHRTPRDKLTYSLAEKMLESSLQDSLRMSAEDLRAASESWAREQVAGEF